MTHDNTYHFNSKQIEAFDKVFKQQLKHGMKRLKQNNYDVKQEDLNFTKARLNELEDKIEENFRTQYNQELAYTKVTEIKNTHLFKDPMSSQIEVLKGRYNLLINQKQPMGKKIEKFAYEPVSFYLHKNNDFIQRLNGKVLTKHEKKEQEELEFKKILKNIIVQQGVEQRRREVEAER